MTPERYNRITQVLNRRQPDLTVITDEVHKPPNIAAIVRSCDAVGIDQIHCVMPRKGYQIYGKAFMSADKWVEMLHHESVEQPISELQSNGYQIVAADLTPNTVDYREIDYTRPTAILMGAEVDGVSTTASQSVDYHIRLPMVGMVESYNVSVASSLILNEAQRQREAAGLYETCRLSDEIYKARFFNWAHPVLAEFCDEKSIPYPEVREDGEVLDLPKWYKSVSE